MDKVQYLRLHEENKVMLLKIVNGRVDPNNPQPITLPDASCLIAKVIDNGVRMLGLVNQK